MPAMGFRRIDNDDFGPDVYGQVWRVHPRYDTPVSLGMKNVEKIVLGPDWAHIVRRNGHRLIPTAEVEYVLIDEKHRPQQTLTGFVSV